MGLNGKLELTWVGKDDKKIIDKRILIEDKSKSYGDPNSDNMLIHGDNLLALKSLETKYAGQIKCIYIDPPFNTGAAFEHYDDNLEHSIWLNLMNERFKMLHILLSDDGVIFVNLDDSESAYCKIILDEIFGRNNYLNEIIVATNKSFGFKSTSDRIFKNANHILFYCKDKAKFKIEEKKLYVEKGYDSAYNMFFENTDKEECEWTWRNVREVVANELGFKDSREATKQLGKSFDEKVSEFAIKNASKVFQLASVTGGALAKRKKTIEFSKNNKNIIVRHPNDDMDYMFIGGRRVIPYSDRLVEIDGQNVPGELITDIWDDISIEALAKEGGVDFPKGKKPEKLIQRCIELTTKENDYVLDSFLGSGTTMAVAHKLHRKYIGIEMGDQCYTHVLIRMQNVVNADQTGISKKVNWQGGGGYHFYELSEPLFVKHTILNIYQVNPSFTNELFIEAICSIENYTYKPNGNIHGYSSEKHYIHVTREFVSGAYVQDFINHLADDESITIYCLKHQSDIRLPENVEIVDIMKTVLPKCVDLEDEK